MSENYDDILKGRSYGEIMQSKEDLLPELARAYSENPIPSVKHRYAVSAPHTSEMNAITNVRYLITKREAEAKLKEGDIEGYVFRTERPFRLDALLDVVTDSRKFPTNQPELFARLVADTWIDSEHPSINKDFWRTLISSARRECLPLSPAPKDGASIYRGVYSDGEIDTEDGGISWTTDYEKAVMFAKRKNAAGYRSYVLIANYNGEDFIGVFDTRGESEVVAIEPVKEFNIEEIT